MSIELTQEQRSALAEREGFVQGSEFVLISSATYRRMMGVSTPEELEASLRAIEEGLADVEAGRTRPFREVLDELSKSCDVSTSN